MIGEVFRFELWYRLRQPSMLAWAAFLVGVPFLLMHAINGSRMPLNAPEMVANVSAVLGTVGMVVTAALFGDAAMRDVETRMYALFYTVPLGETDYLAGRFLGALAVNAVLLSDIPLGLLAASRMPFMSAGKFGPFVAATYVQPYLLVLLPNLVLSADDEDERRDLGLPPHPPKPSWSDTAARRWHSDRHDADLVDLETIVGTDERQIAVAVGTLQREWREGGRRYVQYRTESPLSFAAPVFAAEYAVRDARWTPPNGAGQPVALRVLYHPTHGVNVDRMLRAMQASLDYYGTHFGPYQFRELRVVEFPRYAAFARGYPHMIAYSEGSAFLTRVDSGDVDRPFFVTAHETAHQWWAGQVMGARVRGAAFLTEMLAQYSSMMVMEQTLGREQARKFYDFEMRSYLSGRHVYTNREAPLLDVEDQAYVYYHKGAVAMYTLRERIGADSVNAALQRYLRKYRDAGPPYPTSRDLYAELQAVTPDSVKPLLRDLFETITLRNVRTETARVEPVGAGAVRVTLDVVASKVRADSVGTETAVPMDDLVEIGVFADANGGALGEPLYLQPHRLHAGRQTIVVTVPRAPARAGLDPYHELIDREPDDNVVAVGLAPRSR